MMYALLLLSPYYICGGNLWAVSWNIFQLIFRINFYYVLHFAAICLVNTSSLEIKVESYFEILVNNLPYYVASLSAFHEF
jgi:hypothetical protein